MKILRRRGGFGRAAGPGAVVPVENYGIIEAFILLVLRQDETVTMTSLVEQARNSLRGQVKGDLGWNVVRVKQDMERRKLIVTRRQGIRDRNPVIALPRKRRSLPKQTVG